MERYSLGGEVKPPPTMKSRQVVPNYIVDIYRFFNQGWSAAWSARQFLEFWYILTSEEKEYYRTIDLGELKSSDPYKSTVLLV